MRDEAGVTSRQLDPARITRLKNSHCSYCFRVLAADVPRDTDHVIGRRFVPKQALAGNWKLLVRACRACNAEKAGLEAEVSSVTLHQLASGAGATDDLVGDPAAFLAEVRRKGTARSPVTGRFVRESETSNTVEGRIGPASLSFTLCGPPQLDPDRVLKLASMHVRGLSTLIFTRDEPGGPGYLPGTFVLCAEAGRGDWGADRVGGFMERVRTWPARLRLDGAAGGYFRAAIRKEPGPRPIWAWALEWNRQHRTMGFMGDDEAALIGLCDALPEHTWTGERTHHDPERGRVVQRWRREIPLPPDADDLFSPSWSEVP